MEIFGNFPEKNMKFSGPFFRLTSLLVCVAQILSDKDDMTPMVTFRRGMVFGEVVYHSTVLHCTLYTPCLKKLCQLIFGSLSVKYEPISIKIGSCVQE